MLALGLLLSGMTFVYAQADPDMAVRGLVYGGACQGELLTYIPSGEFTGPLTKAQAQEMAAQYVAKNPNLEVGKVREKDGMYVVEVVTKKGRSFVHQMNINKKTGLMQSAMVQVGGRHQGDIQVGVGWGGRGMGRGRIGGGRGMGRGGAGRSGIRGGGNDGIRARQGQGPGGGCCGACFSSTLTYTPSGELAQPLTEAQVQVLMADYIVRNPNLKVGKVTEKDDVYVVEIVKKKEGDLVDKIAINKKTAKMQPVE
jgi:hypothetical protein